jgi:hypothetical protein
MVCFRSRRLAAGFLVCVCSVALGACGGKKDEGKGGDDKGGTSAASNKDLDMIPAESDVVLGVDLAGARQSALFREYALPMMTRSGDVQKLTETLKTKCQLDPMAAATRLTAGIKIVDRRNADVVAVLHGVEKAKALPCLDQVKDELAAQQLEVTKDGDVVTIKGDRGELAFTFTGDSTAVIVLGPKANKAGVLEAAQGKSTLKSSKKFTDMYSRVQTTHTLWYLVKGDTELVAKNLEKLNVRAEAIFGSANLTDGLEIYGQLRAETEEQASNVVDLVKAQAGMFGSMAQKFEVDRDKTDVKTTVVLTQQQLKTVAGLLRSLVRGSR